jgi:hypothetical protein
VDVQNEGEKGRRCTEYSMMEGRGRYIEWRVDVERMKCVHRMKVWGGNEQSSEFEQVK